MELVLWILFCPFVFLSHLSSFFYIGGVWSLLPQAPHIVLLSFPSESLFFGSIYACVATSSCTAWLFAGLVR